MIDVDTSDEAVESAAAFLEQHTLLVGHKRAAAMLRALLAERDALREAQGGWHRRHPPQPLYEKLLVAGVSSKTALEMIQSPALYPRWKPDGAR